MELALIISGALILLLLLYLNIISSLCLHLDPDIESVQKWGQSIFVWLVPFAGAVLILHLVKDHSPEVVLRFRIPWPFKNWVLGKPLRKSTYSGNAEEIPGLHGAGGNLGGGSSSSGGGD